jgi:8-oxo-dGTP pyrophosphatase MutT (NUDIX family)
MAPPAKSASKANLSDATALAGPLLQCQNSPNPNSRTINGSEALIIKRESVRALLLTSAHDVLLMRIRRPDNHEVFWIAPGGGLEEGEQREQALKREVYEELGLRAFEMGPLVWRRQHTFHWDGRRICQTEHYHIVVVDRFDPQMSDPTEAKILDQFRWWHASELQHTRERLTPLSLAKIVAGYLTSGPPATPPAWEVLVD